MSEEVINLVNIKEIQNFLEKLRTQFNNPLMITFIDYKIGKLIKTNHHYEKVVFERLSDQEKNLVKDKPGIYHRALLNKIFYQECEKFCEEFGQLVISGKVKTNQDVTNTPDLHQVSATLFPKVVWSDGWFDVIPLTNSALLTAEGREMGHCLGVRDNNLSDYFYFSLSRNQKSMVSFKISKNNLELQEARHHYNKAVTEEQYQSSINNFVSEYFKKERIELFCVKKFHWGRVPLFLYFQWWGVLGMIMLTTEFGKQLGFLDKSYANLNSIFYNFIGLFVCFLFMIATENSAVRLSEPISRKSKLGKLMEWVNG